VTAAHRELVVRGVHALRRSGLWWGVGLLVLALVTVAFWPSLEATPALEDLEDMGGLLEAFGAQGIATPAGYLDGQLYALMLPLLLSGMAVAQVSALTAGDEDAGRLELLHALPVGRQAVWLARWVAATLVLVTVAAVATAVVVGLLPAFSLEEAGVGRVVAASAGCVLLAVFHGAVAFAAGGFGASRGLAVGLAVLVLVAGYVASFLLPLADALAGARSWSPWHWALGQQPVSDGVSPAWQLLLATVVIALVWSGAAALDRRDVRSA
jgi:ABC-2 type transport system permease protein